MFCKWCGNTIQTVDEKCPSCGRITPALSDCGGFYNLRQKVSNPEPPYMPSPRCPIMDKLENRYVKDQKKAKAQRKVLLYMSILEVLLLIVIGIGLLCVCGKVNELEESIQYLHTEENVELPTEVFEEVETVTEETRPYHFQMKIALGNSEQVLIDTSHDFDTYAQVAQVQTSSEEKDGNKVVNVCYLLNPMEAYAKVAIADECEDSGDTQISIVFDTNIDLFENVTYEYIWSYQDVDGIWTDVDSQMVQTDALGGSRLICGKEWVETFAGNAVELQCMIAIENSEGDTMNVFINGISVYSVA